MTLAFLAALLLSANPSPPPKRVDLAMPPPPPGAKPAILSEKLITMAAPALGAVNLDEKTVTFFAEQLSANFALQGLKVTTAKEIDSIVGLERQKQLLGCTEQSTSCMAELANALGVETVLNGQLAKVGRRYTVLFKILRAADGGVLSLYSSQVSSEEELIDELSNAAAIMAPEVATKLGRKLTPKARQPKVGANSGGGLKSLWWAPAGVGVLSAVAGGAGLYFADAKFRALNAPLAGTTIDQGRQLYADGKFLETMGLVGLGVGAVGVGTGLGFLLFGGSSSSQLAVLPTSGGALVTFGGAL